MTRSGHRVTRGHLSLADASSRPPPAPPRTALLTRAMLARIRVFFLNLLAVAGTLLALAPLLVRRRPLGHRTQLPRLASRVIAFQPRRRVSPP